MSSPPLITSPKDSAFVPRREFNVAVPVPSTFSLLAFSSPNFLRLSNFPESTRNHVHEALKSRGLLKQVKEDKAAGLCKFVLAGKPWSSPKNIDSEALAVRVLAVILSEGYQFLSLIDYAKEAGDILSLVFSKPVTAESPSPNQSEMCLVPFGLSFVSSTVVRVINPPLAHTPAILKAVREAWPRGIVTERKTGSSTFEFKLKGYSWIAEDTFYEDSMNNTLALLSSLSLLGFNLLTSLSFTPGRHGDRDFWLMVGYDVRPDNSSLPSVSTLGSSSLSDTRNPSMDGRPDEFVSGQHARSATVPTAPLSHHREWSETAATQPLHAATESLPASPPPSKPVPADLPQDVDADTVSWDAGSDRAPSPLAAHSPADEDEPITPPPLVGLAPPAPKAVGAAMPVRVTDAGSPPSMHAPIEEAPDIRASQVVYSTPAPPRLSPHALDDADLGPPIMRGPLSMPIPTPKMATPTGTPGTVETPGIPPFPGGYPPA